MDEARRWFSSFNHFPLIVSAFGMEAGLLSRYSCQEVGEIISHVAIFHLVYFYVDISEIFILSAKSLQSLE